MIFCEAWLVLLIPCNGKQTETITFVISSRIQEAPVATLACGLLLLVEGCARPFRPNGFG